MKFGFLAIGDELLDGRVLDRNGAYVGAKLMEFGLPTSFKRTVSDSFSDISDALDAARDRVDVLVISGGLGPTVDDLTTDAVAQWLGCSSEFREDVWGDVRAIFEARGIACPETNRKQACFPIEAQVLSNPLGTAPGFCSGNEDLIIYCLPGVHREFKTMMDNEVFPRILKGQDTVGQRHIFRLLGARESHLATLLNPIPLEEGESIHYQASFPDLAVLLRSTSSDETRWRAWCEAVRSELTPWLYGEGEARIGEIVVNLLNQRNWTLATAESCTGGLISQLVTGVPGASRVFLEGAVTYSNESKIRILNVSEEDLSSHGAVSRETVIQMATGCLAKSGASVAIATSGIAGPGGGSPEKPVGTVHLALAVRGEPVVHQLLKLRGARKENQVRSAWAALKLLIDRLHTS